jgi:hypothetical protein
LLKHAEGKLSIEAGFKLTGASPLHFAVYLSTTEMVKILIDAGSNVGHINGGGATKLMDAVSNPACTTEMLEMLRSCDVNQPRTARTRKWYFIYRIFERMYKSRFVTNTALIKEVAHNRGATALHFAARCGHVHEVEWLLENGAHLSLHVRNKLGCTPNDVARIFGPFPVVEKLLVAAMLDKNIHARYIVSRGSELSRRDACLSEDATLSMRGLELPNTPPPATVLAPAMELAPDATHSLPHVSEPQSSGGGSGSGAGGEDNNGDGETHGVWNSLTSAITDSFSKRVTTDAPPPILSTFRESTPHSEDSVRQQVMLMSIMEAQTRTLAQTTALMAIRADNAAIRADMQNQTSALREDNAAIRADNAAMQAQITSLRDILKVSA